MKHKLLVAATLAVGASAAQANVTLPKLLSDGCVLQRNQPVRLYGTADPGEAVTLTLKGKTVKATTGGDGKWLVSFPAQGAGGPFVLSVKGKNTLTVKDVYFGEVWVCSGQSNMEWPLSASFEAKSEIESAPDPLLRMFTVQKSVELTPQEEVAGGSWQAAAPNTRAGFSAVGYYFAKQLRKALGVPIGMLHTSWGGTRIEAWMAKDVNLGLGMNASEFATPVVAAEAKARYERLVARWKAAGSPQGVGLDAGRSDKTTGWERGGGGDVWKSANAPGEWDTLGNEELLGIDGAVWFKKEVEVPEALAGKPLKLSLGAIDDHDVTFFNGQKVGAIGAETPNSWQAPRNYTVPGELVKKGRNVIVVRVFDGSGGGGFVGSPDDMKLGSISLAGEWAYRVERAVPANPGMMPGANPNGASVLYNAMLHPLKNYTVKGGIWYQGESNVGRHELYQKQMPAMIANWQKDFAAASFPFFITQLAPFGNSGSDRIEYAQQREAQTAAMKTVKNGGIAVITDIGNETDIHPNRKGPVGERLAFLAQKIAYGQNVYAVGPTYLETLAGFDKLIVRFDNVGDGLEVREGICSEKPLPAGKLVGFEVSSGDGVFYPAEAKIRSKNEVEVSSSKVKVPRYVRYGYRNFVLTNLWSKSGLPADPFRTDK
ncbi:MAG: sialate O-acetylesterase [Armatimonadetes bacterium]|nr:sialate O-acetylesterase [Armatimonadota bacterium]